MGGRSYFITSVAFGDILPSTTEAPPIGNIRPFSKITVTLEPVMQF